MRDSKRTGPNPTISLPDRQRSPLRIAANRRNAQKSTGPKTPAGKRRVALNALRQGLGSQELMRDLKRRGEDPREFRRLQRDLIAIFQPHDTESKQTVELMAWTWWRKARRQRGWAGPEPVQSADLDQRLEELLLLLVELLRSRHEWWQSRLASVLGWPVGSPANALRRIESRLFIFGAQPGRRSYPNESRSVRLLKRFQEEARRIAAEEASQSGAGSGNRSGTPRGCEWQCRMARAPDL
jgi:hypothetical protein